MFIASRALLGIAGAILPPPMLSLIFKAGAPAQSPADVRVRGLRAGELRAEVCHGGVGSRETDRQELAAQVHEDGPSSQPENTRGIGASRAGRQEQQGEIGRASCRG